MSDYEITLTIKPPFLLIKPFVTEEAYYRDATEDSNWEYLDGRLVMHSGESNWHEDRFGFLLTLLSGYLDERGGAVVLGSRYPMRLDERWSPEPDLLVVRDERRHLLGRTRLEGRPTSSSRSPRTATQAWISAKNCLGTARPESTRSGSSTHSTRPSSLRSESPPATRRNASPPAA